MIRGLDGRGYVKTSEGFGLVTRGCDDPALWRIVHDTTTTYRPSGHAFEYGPLLILEADEAGGVIKGHDPANFWRKGSYVGVFIHRLTDDLRLVEVSSFWDTRSVVLRNPWERDLLDALARRLPCLAPSGQAVLRGAGGGPGQGRLPKPAPTAQPAPASSAIFCRQRADLVRGAGSWREAWLAEYQRCMAGD